jgi:hypothetical protein
MPLPLSEGDSSDDDDDDTDDNDTDDDTDTDTGTNVSDSPPPPYTLPLFSERSIKINLINCILRYADQLEFIMQSESLHAIKFKCFCCTTLTSIVIELQAIKYKDESDFSDLRNHPHLVHEDNLNDSMQPSEMVTMLKKIKMNSAIQLHYIEFLDVQAGTTLSLFTLTNKT